MKIFLSLGSNLGNRLENLRSAVARLKKAVDNVECSLVYETNALIPQDAEQFWDMPYYNLVLAGDTELDPIALLRFAKGIEQEMGRSTDKKWAPRIIDIDILLYGDLEMKRKNLIIPHPEMLKRGFVMLPLKQLNSHLIHPKKGKTISQLIKNLPKKELKFLRTLALEPQIMGIVNLSHNSFSGDGAKSVDEAIMRVLNLINCGASIVDFGAQATGPGAKLQSWSQQLKILSPVMTVAAEELRLRRSNVVFSVDTLHPEVVRNLSHISHFRIVNDVSGGYDISMLELVADLGMQYVLTHSLTVPADPKVTLASNMDVVAEILQWAKRKLSVLHSYGIKEKNVIFDPGIGFGKTPAQSWRLIANAMRLRDELGIRVLIASSRKSFLGQISQNTPQNLDLETAVLASLIEGASIIRVHNVEATARALAAKAALKIGAIKYE